MMTVSKLAFALLLVIPTVPAWAVQDDEPEQQQDGDDDGPAVVPWQAQIYSNFTGWTEQELAERDEWDLSHRCGGSLVSDGWVLTAAHCINQDKVDKGYRVRLGVSSIDQKEGVSYRIDRMVMHSDYDAKSHRNDIALVHYVADGETDGSNVGEIEAIPLYDGAELAIGTKVYASGWGKAEEGKDVGYSSDLTTVDLQVVRCEDFPQYRGKTDANMICARSPDDDDTCTGDSGGPLVTDEEEPRLVGIISWGIGCYRTNSAGVYVRLDANHYADWIDRAMAVDPSVNRLR